MPDQTKDACGNCRFGRIAVALATGTPGKSIVCRRFPTNEHKNAGDWCGEHDRSPVSAVQKVG
jgi:hypothetical protein